ncbi:glycosyltransferase [Enterococcus faecium]|uniref:glycosyltransferase n=1 Tax=Enterococcus faecium TaxID=1352 RepID=UPI0019F8A084|nr:glycosyltransferase [Enterococcus faecium]EGP5124194.1 glycosyltransferase [Enterococcus faecium]EGV5849896.1 glycosyltransferase [Enterococcus faecium]EME3514175.1 glycosyltransferase [Enterococcus faecium]MDW3629217.1 glycosyltransferase [Enterococcus faecium]
MTKEVAVIMSSYNGEMFIEEQIKSIFNQENVQVKLFIRDDGSTDSTIEIIKKLQSNFPIELLIGGKNLKPAFSFLEALKLCPFKADFYSYADQDDIWFPGKLGNACEKLSQYPDDKPNLYCSTYDVVDKNLDLIFTRDLSIYKEMTLQSTLLGITPSGCTMVFNDALKSVLVKSNPSYIRMHDFWTLLTVQALDGKLYVDNRPSMSYRQHESNSVGFSNKTRIKDIKRLIDSAGRDNERLRQAQCVYEEYHDKMSLKNRESLQKLIGYKSNFKDRLSLLADKNYQTAITKTNLLFKASILLGIF